MKGRVDVILTLKISRLQAQLSAVATAHLTLAIVQIEAEQFTGFS